MSQLYDELRDAATAVLARSEQSDEFKRRLMRLVENATIGNLSDDDVRDVIRLAAIQADEE